jgi:NAD(P)-dependent dehydrogenase (short-subunit alcohol dehydrogenase family)
MPEFSGRVAIVTGGADGIGRATALLLARRGAKVFVGDYRPKAENEANFAAAGIVQLQCDVRIEADVQRLVDEAVQRGGGLHILVNNAGIGLVKQIPDVTEAEWDACLDTNLKGAFLASKHATRHLRAAGGGAIVNTASNAGLLPRAHDPVYCISKAALVGLTRSLALCHARDKIRVNCVCPGPVGDTGMINADLAAAEDPAALAQKFIDASPLAKAYGRMIRPEEVAEAICYLASDAAAMVSGTALQIDGGKALGVPPA